MDTDRMTGAAKELGGKIQGALGDLNGSRQDSVEGRLREAGGRAEYLYGQAKDAVRHVADEAYGYAEDIYEHGGHRLRRGTREVSRQVAEYPLASLLIAGFVGFGLGLLVNAGRD